MSFTLKDVLLEFVSLDNMRFRRIGHAWGVITQPDYGSTDEGGLEALRRAWRARQVTRGLCRSCRTPADNDSSYCAKHRARNAERARASYARRKAA